MPNHTDTKLTVTGDKKQLAEFVKNHITKVDGCDHYLDFDTITPCHPDLDKAVSPARTQEDVDRIKKSKHYKSEKDRVRDIKKTLKDMALNQKNIERFGYANWYDFKIAEWGTKWGAYSCELVKSTKSEFVLKYQTAWSPAVPIFQKLSEMYPKLTFENACVDEGWFFAGRFIAENGEVTEEMCEGEDEIEMFCNDELGYNYVRCPKCGERYDANDEDECWQCGGEEDEEDED